MEPASNEWGQVKNLFQATLEMDPDSQRLFLDRQQIPSEIREIVKDLLKAHQSAGSFLNQQPISPSFLLPSSSQNRFAPGALLLDRFQIVRFLAKGGMGEVYEAEDLELQTPVALKVVRTEIADYPGTMARFKREVQLARQVTHPNVCRIFDLFRHRDAEKGDVIFLSMELLHGQTLAEHLQQNNRIPCRESVSILRQVASGLQAAHSAGILHRDLKPSNIVLETTRSGQTRAVITDFGMAWSQDVATSPSVTRSGQLVFGTPDYMSPEQIEGRNLTPASDLYSLGLVLYQMLTGHKAFECETPLLSVLRRLTDTPPAPSRGLPSLNARWDALAARCLDRNPDHRFASAAEFLAALDRTSPRLLCARSYAPLAAMQSRLRAHWKLTVSTAFVITALAWGGTYFVRLHRSAPAADGVTLVLADFVNTTGEPVFDDTLNAALFAKLQQTPYLTLMPDAKVRLALRYMGLDGNEHLTRALARQVCLREGGQAILQGTIASGDHGYDLWLKAYDCASGRQLAKDEVPVEERESALTALDQAADKIRKQLGESRGSIEQYNVALEDASTSSLDALTAYAQGLRITNQSGQVAAEPYFLRAVQIDPEFAIAYARLSSIYADMDEPARASEAALKAYERRDRTSEWEHFYILSSYYAFVTGELEKEKHTYEQWGKIYPHDTVWPTGLMIDYSYFGEYQKAAEMERLQIRNAPETAAAYGNLAQIYLALERPDEARTILDAADRAHLHEINMDWERYALAFYNNDKAGMNSVLAHASSYPGLEETLLEQQATTEAYFGHMRASRTATRKAWDAAMHDGDKETAAVWLSRQALWESELGINNLARDDIAQARDQSAEQKSKTAQIIVALASANIGNEREAQQIAADLSASYPLDSMLHQYWLPLIRARIALHNGKPADAINMLSSTTPFETGLMDPLPCMYSTYVRGLAHLQSGQNLLAAADFRSVLAHRGLVLNYPLGALAQLGLARSLRQLHNVEESRIAYRNTLALWKDADADLALARKASQEYASVQ